MGFPWQEYWSVLSFPFPGDLPYPGIKLRSPALQADSWPSEPSGNASQNHNEISPHTSQNGHHEKKIKTLNAGEGVEKRELSSAVGGNVNWHSHYREQYAAAAAKLLQLCPTLCDAIDGSPPGFPVPGILQARTLEWVAISFSNVGRWRVKVKSLSHVWPLVTPWTAAYQAPPSIGFSRQEY